MRTWDEVCKHRENVNEMMNSVAGVPRKTAESTGRLPPTPTPRTASRDASVRKLLEPPAAKPKIPAMRSVILKDHLKETFSITYAAG